MGTAIAVEFAEERVIAGIAINVAYTMSEVSMEQRLVDAHFLALCFIQAAKHFESMNLIAFSDFLNAIGNDLDCGNLGITVDAVPVVRCKDCEHYRNGICEKIEYIMDGYYHGTFDVKRPDDFCSYGVKKSGGGENANA